MSRRPSRETSAQALAISRRPSREKSAQPVPPSPGPRRGAAAEVAYADANVFVSLFAGPAHPTHEAALVLFRRVAEGMLALVLTPVIVAELVYVCTRLLGWSRLTLAQRLTALFEADGLLLSEGATLASALQLYATRSSLDFADAYLAACAIVVGPGAVASFDRDIDGIKGVRRITS